MATALLALAIISTGLYAGFMLTFRTGIMPALAQLSDEQFLAAMRRINEVVPRPLFLLTFFSYVAFPALSLAFPVGGRTGTQRWLLIAGLVCAVISHLITMGGNVPLNNALAAAEKKGTEKGTGNKGTETGTGTGNKGTGAEKEPEEEAARGDREARTAFEPRWNRLHLVRTLFTVASFALVVSSALS
ncbi:anthrone oxygenase family protein [Streptomyces sp. NPDC055078]